MFKKIFIFYLVVLVFPVETMDHHTGFRPVTFKPTSIPISPNQDTPGPKGTPLQEGTPFVPTQEDTSRQGNTPNDNEEEMKNLQDENQQLCKKIIDCFSETLKTEEKIKEELEQMHNLQAAIINNKYKIYYPSIKAYQEEQEIRVLQKKLNNHDCCLIQ